jgi:ADP-ribose pyrophosphatase YjhB (NUDIX family)
MSARVKVRAAIWVEGWLVVHRHQVRGEPRQTLPGGWLNDRESVTDALRREVDEEIGLEIEVGDLLFAAEVLNSASRQDVELIFAASFLGEVDPATLHLVDPLSPEANDVLPPVLGELARYRDGQSPPGATLWLGNLYQSGRSS